LYHLVTDSHVVEGGLQIQILPHFPCPAPRKENKKS
jgi:hypothetical protein